MLTVGVPAKRFYTNLSGEKFEIPSGIRFRKEDGFYVVNIRWANAFTIESDLAEHMMECQTNKTSFTLAEMKPKVEDARTSLIYMIFKDGIEPVDKNLKDKLDGRSRLGASVNPFELPVGTTDTSNNLIAK